MPSKAEKRPEYWKSPAVRWLLEKSKASDPEMLMREEARRLIDASGQNNPPFSPERVKRLRNVERIEWVTPPNLSGLVPIQGGFVIRVRNELRDSGRNLGEEDWTRPFLGRENFSIAHEIGHTFFYDIELPVPSRPAKDTGSRAEEKLCDVFASELLMPAERLKRDARQLLQKENHCIEVLTKLAITYRVSVRAIVGRLLELGIIGNVIVIRWDWLLKPNEPGDSMPKLRVDWAIPNTYPYIPRLKPAPKGSIFEQASSILHILREHSVPINIGSLKGVYQVEALSYGESKSLFDRYSNEQRDLRSVLSIVWLGEPSKT